MDLFLSVFTDMQPGRLTESLIFLAVLWWKFKPHLTKVENEITGVRSELMTMNDRMAKGFEEGEKRFELIEYRLSKVENKTKE